MLDEELMLHALTLLYGLLLLLVASKVSLLLASILFLMTFIIVFNSNG